MLRRKAVEILSRVSSGTGIVHTIDRTNGRRGGVILVFHETTPKVLARQLGQVAEMYAFVSLDEFVSRLAAGRSTVGIAAITFDDGIGEATEAAAALALAHGWPMTFYLPTRYLDTAEPYWFLELDLLLSRTKAGSFSYNGKLLPIGDQAAIQRTSSYLRGYFKTLPTVKDVDAAMRQIRLALFGSDARPQGLPVPAPIAWARVKELASNDQISFQAHTVNHLAVSRLTEQQLIHEMEYCRDRIEAVTGCKVRHFCYPYGSPNEIGADAPNVVRRFFTSATTTSRGRCSSGVDLARLPRVPVDIADSEDIVAFKVGTAR